MFIYPLYPTFILQNWGMQGYNSAESRSGLLFLLHLRQKKSPSLYFHFSWFIINLDISGSYTSDDSFGSRVFSNFTIVGNGNSSIQELQNSVLDC